MSDRRVRLLEGSLLLCVLLAGCGRNPATGVVVDPAFGPLVPPDTKLLAGARLDKLRSTPLYEKLNERFDLDRRLDLFSERTGLDLRKDVSQVLLASNGNRALVMARGRFNVEEMEPKLGALGTSRIKYKNYTLFGNAETSVVFLETGVAIAGPQMDLKDVLDHRADHSQLPDKFAGRLRAMPAADQVWLISNGVFPASLLSGPDTTGMKSLLSNFVDYIQSAQLGLHADQGAELKGNIDCISGDGAQRVRDALKGMVGFARLGTRSDQTDLLKLLDTVQVSQSAAHVSLSAELPPDLVEPLLKMPLPGRMR
ncbi:MAG: hypothetical protein WB676_05485 [Bryobacteraceae bacterium]